MATLILPELAALSGALAFFLLSLVHKPALIRPLALLFAAALCAAGCYAFQEKGLLFAGAYQISLYSQFFKLLIGLTLAVLLIGGQDFKSMNPELRPEYLLFTFLCAFGLMLLVSAVELITLFVALELASFSLYLLTPMREDRGGIRMQMEAGIKYLLFGVIASGLMLYGMSYIFGLSGSTYLSRIAVFYSQASLPPAALIALLLVLSAFLFKLALFPFHFWAPDVYQGAANETASLIATLPKLGAMALLIRLLQLMPSSYELFFVNFFAVLALASMFHGNLSALVQQDLKRMLAFSAIAHAGFMALAFLPRTIEGYSLALYYLNAYVLMNLVCFLVISAVSSQGENVTIQDLNGLHKRQPLLAFVLAAALFALAGIPPFAGFMGKFMVLKALVQTGHLGLVILAALNTAIAIYYYLVVVKAVYTAEPGEDTPPIVVQPLFAATCILLTGAIVLLGLFPSKYLSLAHNLVQSLG